MFNRDLACTYRRHTVRFALLIDVDNWKELLNGFRNVERRNRDERDAKRNERRKSARSARVKLPTQEEFSGLRRRQRATRLMAVCVVKKHNEPMFLSHCGTIPTQYVVVVVVMVRSQKNSFFSVCCELSRKNRRRRVIRFESQLADCFFNSIEPVTSNHSIRWVKDFCVRARVSYFKWISRSRMRCTNSKNSLLNP